MKVQKLQNKTSLMSCLMISLFILGLAGNTLAAEADSGSKVGCADNCKIKGFVKGSGEVVSGTLKGGSEVLDGFGQGAGAVFSGFGNGVEKSVNGFSEGVGNFVRGGKPASDEVKSS